MATITTKYSVGDTVFYASTETERRQHPCPDCKGSRQWKALSPAGGEYSFACPRCGGGYSGHSDLSLAYTAHVPAVRRLTVGSVQYNSAPGAYDSGARYMCVETGIGSGSVYSESDLFEDETTARQVAEIKAKESDQSVEWVAKLYDKTLAVSDYQLENALLKQAADASSHARSMLWNLNGLFDAISEADGKNDIIEAVEDYKRYDWSRDKNAAKEASEP